MVALKRFREEDNGAEMVEFALISMILLLLLIGIIQFGLIFNVQLSLENAARDGARQAAIPSSLTDTEIKNNIINNLPSSIQLNAGNISITPTVRQRYQPVTVTITYQYKVLVTMGVLPEEYTLTAKAVMMME